MNQKDASHHGRIGRVVEVVNKTTVAVDFGGIIMPVSAASIQLYKEANHADGYSWDAIGDSGATGSFVPSKSICYGPVTSLRRPVVIGGIRSKVKATHKGVVRLRPNVRGRDEVIDIKVLVVPRLKRALIGIRKLDDRGYYMDHGGGALRIHNGPHGANLMVFHRRRDQPRTSASHPAKGPILEMASEKKDMSKLYPIPDKCFVTKVNPSDKPVAVDAMARRDKCFFAEVGPSDKVEAAAKARGGSQCG